ncbi:PAS domain S-box protein [Comamonas aquatica]
MAEQHDAHVQKHINQPDKPIGAHSREVLGLRKDGRLIPIELTIGKAQTPSGTIFVGYLQDISERKRTDAQLRIAASVFQHVREGVAIVDANHNISEANPAFLRLMEQTRDSCIGKPLEALYEDADLPPDTGKLWKTVATAHYWQDEITLTRRDSSAWVLRLSISPVLNELQRPHHFIAVASDVTERPGLEAQLPHDALHDAATGLPNPQLFMARLGSQLQHSQRKSTFLGVAIVHLSPQARPATQPTTANHDAAMAWLAQWLHQQLRSPDKLARWQDHQLALALPGIQDPAAWLHMTQRLAQTLVEAQQLCQPYGIQSLQLGCSCTLVPVGTAAELVERACADLQPLPASRPPTPANAAHIKENP